MRTLMMTNDAILKRLHQKGWDGQHLGDVGEDGENALMAALQHPEFRQIPYRDHALVEALLEHPQVDAFGLDKEGQNAFSYVWDFEYAYPLLVTKGVNINHLDALHHHFLECGVQFALEPQDILSYHARIELALALGVDPYMQVRQKALIKHFHGEYRETFDRFIKIQEEKVLLSQLPEASGIKPKHVKL